MGNGWVAVAQMLTLQVGPSRLSCVSFFRQFEENTPSATVRQIALFQYLISVIPQMKPWPSRLLGPSFSMQAAHRRLQHLYP